MYNCSLLGGNDFYLLVSSKDPRLEGVLQNAVRRSLQEMGQRCVQELEKEARPAT